MIKTCYCGGARIETTEDQCGPVFCGENLCRITPIQVTDQILMIEINKGFKIGPYCQPDTKNK